MPYKIVLADSSPAVQKVVQMALAEPKFEVHIVEDGLEVVAVASRASADAVLLSLSLPSRDGYEVGRQLRTRDEFKRTVLFLIKNAFEPLDQERLRGLDYDKIVAKPFDSEKLAGELKELIERKKIPPSFPEESLLEEIPAAGVLPLFKEEEFIPPPHASLPPDDVEEKVGRVIREEVLSVEREIEKRLKASLRAELKEWLEQEKKRTP